jgi:hypothetical protein
MFYRECTHPRANPTLPANNPQHQRASAPSAPGPSPPASPTSPSTPTTSGT